MRSSHRGRKIEVGFNRYHEIDYIMYLDDSTEIDLESPEGYALMEALEPDIQEHRHGFRMMECYDRSKNN